MMSRCFTRFPKGGYRRTQYIPELGGIYKNCGFYLESVWLWRISGGYSHEMMGLVLTITSIYFPNKT